jgi:protein O-GlcNAc transferase
LPFGLLALVDDGRLQAQAAHRWLLHELPAWPQALPSVVWPAVGSVEGRPRRPGPWRIGWLSADFRGHAMTRLMLGAFELMDQVAFEHHALSITPALPGDPMQQHLRAALGRWHELHGLDDLRAAQAIAALQLDVLVDLGGLTRSARPGVLARRPAPWQVAYLGYMGTSGLPAPRSLIDATVADDITVPPAHQIDFSEQVLRLPSGLWPREASLLPANPAEPEQCAPAARGQVRQSHGLPATGFVFCNFCDAAKLNPSLFDVWMRLLHAVPGSVLWLLRGSDEMVTHLQAEAAQRGVAPPRLVWADRLPLQAHLMRHAAADLFLDTWPFNGHTTVADALMAGLPVLTLQGRTMAARVAASQLHTQGLTELVCHDVAAYEALAVALAGQPQRLAQLRQALRAAQRLHTGPGAVKRHVDELLTLLVSGQPAGAVRA